jgi:hypothetical protein
MTFFFFLISISWFRFSVVILILSVLLVVFWFLSLFTYFGASMGTRLHFRGIGQAC